MSDPLKKFSKQLEDKVKLGLVLLQKFLNERNPREKQLILVMGILGIVCLDYWLFIHPVIKIYADNFSHFEAQKTELKGLEDDQKNKKFIEKNWRQSKENLEESDKRFIASNEMPAFLENISKLALNSGVKMISLQPLENSNKNGKKDGLNPYTGAPIKMSALGGTHEFGKFLSSLEANATFMKITELRISHNSTDDRKHVLELSMEVYRKEALP